MYKFIENGTVTTVQGFKAAGIHSGIKKKKKDLSLIYSENECSVAGTFTINKVKAAPLLLSQDVIAKNGKVKAVLVNSGNANACTGEKGYQDAIESQKAVADVLKINQNEVLVSSTGVIGQLMPMEKLLKGIKKVVPELSVEGGFDAAQGIMTTDTKMKSFAVEIQLSKGTVKIGSICKGSGMIMPNMATMLGFITCDAQIDNALIKKMLVDAVGVSFNKISVDGETSTNDMVILMANGLSKIEVKENTEDYNLFLEGLTALCKEMAKSIISDGEGATKLVTVNILNAKTKKDADMVGKSIANSNLVKTALYGEDANWGRIMSAAGMSGANIKPEKITISLNDLTILKPNYEIILDEEKAKVILAKSEFAINVDLAQGSENVTWWTCDLTNEYVNINANYRT